VVPASAAHTPSLPRHARFGKARCSSEAVAVTDGAGWSGCISIHAHEAVPCIFAQDAIASPFTLLALARRLPFPEQVQRVGAADQLPCLLKPTAHLLSVYFCELLYLALNERKPFLNAPSPGPTRVYGDQEVILRLLAQLGLLGSLLFFASAPTLFIPLSVLRLSPRLGFRNPGWREPGRPPPALQ
jgi:hypothetical protein